MARVHRDSLNSLPSPLRDAYANGHMHNPYLQHPPPHPQMALPTPSASTSRFDNSTPQFPFEGTTMDPPRSAINASQDSVSLHSHFAVAAQTNGGRADSSNIGEIFNQYSAAPIQSGQNRLQTPVQTQLPLLNAAPLSDARAKSHMRSRSQSAVGWEHGLLVPPDADQPVGPPVGYAREEVEAASFAGPSTRRRRKGGWTSLEEGTLSLEEAR